MTEAEQGRPFGARSVTVAALDLLTEVVRGLISITKWGIVAAVVWSTRFFDGIQPSSSVPHSDREAISFVQATNVAVCAAF